MLLENLESRRMLSVSMAPSGPVWSGQTVMVNGTSRADTIEITREADTLVVNDNGWLHRFVLSSLRGIVVKAHGGNDTVRVVGDATATLSNEIWGGDGADTLRVEVLGP